MTISRGNWCFLFFVIFSAAAPAVRAEASALAKGGDNSWGWATRDTQREANKIALEKCNESTAQKDCKLDTTKAIAEAVSGKNVSWGRSSISMADAKIKALKDCPGCRVVKEIKDPGFYSLAKAVQDERGDSNFHLTYGGNNSDENDTEALQKCFDQVGRKCVLVWYGAISGEQKAEVAFKPQPVFSKNNCRPQTSSITCSSQCTNGNCIVSYENGCKIRVQVQPVFDGIGNKWDYPAPSC